MTNSQLEEIETAALQAAQAKRARQPERQLTSREEEDGILTAWVEEAERRADAYEGGEMEAVDFDEAVTQARARIANRGMG